MQYIINIGDRDYTKWSCIDRNTMTDVQIEIDPIKNKYLNGDIIEKTECDGVIKYNRCHSPVMAAGALSGILILDDTCTYGKYNKKLLYKCIPDDKRLPIFLVPYSDKNSSFYKKKTNKYVLFSFLEWSDKHPYGELYQTLGDVDNLQNYYEYQLYCKSLHSSMAEFNKKTRNKFKTQSHDDYINKIIDSYQHLEDRRDRYIFTIDPLDSLDFDDAMGIQEDEEYVYLSIYISNVPLWLDILDLWSAFSERVATIYLPDYKRPMLPTKLSDCLCSLIEGETRFAFTLDLKIKKDGENVDISFTNSIVKIAKNFDYESSELIKNINYCKVVDTVKKLSCKSGYNYVNKINNSHDLVTYLMIMMNHVCSREMHSRKNGIYRAVQSSKSVEIPDSLPNDVRTTLHIWKCYAGQYTLFNNDVQHDLLELDTYLHITSPIRRLVDLLNIMQLQWDLGLIEKTKQNITFHANWITRIEYINTTMRSIRKVQNDCYLLHLCNSKNEIIDNVHKGYVFDRIRRNDGMFHYMVYIPEFKLTNRIVTLKELDDYSCHLFNIFVFNDETTLKKKIRLQLLVK